MLRDLVPSVWSRPISHRSVNPRRDVDPLQHLERHLDRFFEDFWRDVGAPTHVANGSALQTLMSPRVDIAETGDAYVVTAELPGMEEKDIDVSFADGMLVIKGEKSAESERSERTYYVRERAYGHFHREIPLNAEIDADKIEAGYKNGILTVTLPKTPEAQRKVKRITVKT